MSIYMDDEDDPFLIKKWREAEVADPADDGWHFVKCPSCQDDMYTVQWEYGDGRVTLYRFTTARRAKVFAWLTIRLEKMLRKMGR